MPSIGTIRKRARPPGLIRSSELDYQLSTNVVCGCLIGSVKKICSEPMRRFIADVRSCTFLHPWFQRVECFAWKVVTRGPLSPSPRTIYPISINETIAERVSWPGLGRSSCACGRSAGNRWRMLLLRHVSFQNPNRFFSEEYACRWNTSANSVAAVRCSWSAGQIAYAQSKYILILSGQMLQFDFQLPTFTYIFDYLLWITKFFGGKESMNPHSSGYHHFRHKRRSNRHMIISSSC
jgi:hypothetical protein